MNAFEHQDQARRASRRLVVLFILAVLTLILLATALIYGLFFYIEGQGSGMMSQEVLLSEVFLTVSLGVAAVVGLAILFRMRQLRGGGEAVAESLGGRVLNTDTRDADERKVLNVVEEMAIASGIPVPPVYLLEDPTINAFAAGYRPEDAVIGVTRGCIAQLNRDELQGVVAHEFSHIVHGDMRLNLRLVGVLYGIMVLGVIGFHILRGGVVGAHVGRSHRRDNRGQGGAIVALGLGLIVIGYGGIFFGKLIRSAVSRQREFLADASAVQFTRNPAGIAGALAKIGGYGSRLYSVDASEISHMLIGEGGKPAFATLFSTHPPIEERIRRIQPGWDGERLQPEPQPASAREQAAAGHRAMAGFASAASIIDTVGNPDAGHLAAAGRELDRIPSALSEALHEPYAARGVMLALVMAASSPSSREQQMQDLLPMLDVGEQADLLERAEQLASLQGVNHLTLVELAMPALKQLSPAQQAQFRKEMMQLIMADQQVTLFEWSLYRLIEAGFQTGAPRRQRGTRRLEALKSDAEQLLSTLACAGQTGSAAREQAFNAARETLGISSLMLKEAAQINIPALDKSVARLIQLHPLHKPRLLKAMVECCMADGRLNKQEGELLRAVAALLDCPLPPLQTQQQDA